MKAKFMTPIATAFNSEGKIDYKACEDIIEFLIRGGISGIAFLGSTGEFFSISYKERKEFAKFAIEKVNKRVDVLIGTGGMDIDECIEFTNFVHSLGADGALVISPYYFTMSDECLENYYSKLAGNTQAKIYLYNFPDRTGSSLNPLLILKLAKKYKNIVGIKDSIPSMGHTREIITTVLREVPNFEVYSGFEEYFVLNLLAGGAGCIGGISNIVPQICGDWVKAYENKEFGKLMEIQKIINNLSQLYTIDNPFISVLKKGMMLVGVTMEDYVTEPFIRLSDEKTEIVKRILEESKVI
jgi:4-hydroxy-tetrahydrodipicolinate synthase